MKTSRTTVVFDVGNVLIEWEPAILYSRIFPDPDERDKFLATVCSPEWNKEQDRGRPWGEAIALLLDTHPEQADAIKAYYDRWHEMVPGEVPGTPDLLGELKAAEVPLFAITNFSEEKFRECQSRFPFLGNSFQDIVISGVERLLKPDPAIYRCLFERNNLDPRACVFIDDSPANITAANNEGMEGLLFTSADNLRSDLRTLGFPA